MKSPFSKAETRNESTSAQIDPESKPTNRISNGSPSSPQNERSYHDDPDMQGLTLFEKKALLVNRELASQGMGRYQWMIFLLCGFGYFLDLLWAQAFGLILSPLQQEFGFSDPDLGNLGTAFSAGLTAGAAFWGILVDLIGRYWAFNFTVLVSSIFGICLGAPSTYTGVIVLTAFVGFGIGGNIPIDTTICLELLPQDNRWLLPTLSLFQPLGVVLCSALAYAFIPFHSCAADLKACSLVANGTPCCTKSDNYGWRYLMFCLGGITIGIFIFRFVLFRFQESPKFLLTRGKDDKAVKVLEYIASYNKVQCHTTLADFEALTAEDDSVDSQDRGKIVLGSGAKLQSLPLLEKAKLELIRLKVLFGNRHLAQLTLSVWIIYMWDFWGFTIAGNYLPYIIKQNNVALGTSIESTYRSYIYIYLFGIPGVLAGTTIYRWRRISLFVSCALFGAMLFTFTAVTSEASYIGISGLIYFFQSMFNAILYGSTPEFFPAPIRGTACGVASFWGRIMSIIAPLAGAQVIASAGVNAVMYLAGGGVFIAMIFILLIPGRYIGHESY